MSDPFKRLKDIEQKCRIRAAELPTRDKKGEWVGIGFRIGDTRLLSRMGEVTEILEMPEFTRVPGVKPWVVGIANVRGSLMPLMDLKEFVTGEGTNRKKGRVLVVNYRGTNTGLIVDEVLGMRHFNQDEQTYEMPAVDSALKPYIKQAFHRDDQFWPVFSLQALADDERFLNAAV
jgi:twitching motility protein PilI